MPVDPLLLLTPTGAAVLERVAAANVSDELALISRLRREFPAALVTAAVEQQRLRTAARAKFSDPSRLLFTRAGLEQASSERVSRHRADRLARFGEVADLCCGIGADLITLAAGHATRAVDRDPVHLRLAEHNAAVSVPSADVAYVHADVRDVPVEDLDAAFVDPARREDSDRRVDGEPPLAWCASLPVPTVVKAAPAIPDELVPDGWEAEFVAEGRELKEATLYSPPLATTARRATVLTADGTATLVDEPGDPPPLDGVQHYLLDPNPAVTRAGLVTTLARRIGAAQLDPQIAFLTTEIDIHTAFARTLPVLDSFPWREKAVIAALRAVDAGSVEVRRRGLGGDVDALTRQLRQRLPRDGRRRVLVAMTRVADRPWAIVCDATDQGRTSSSTGTPTGSKPST